MAPPSVKEECKNEVPLLTIDSDSSDSSLTTDNNDESMMTLDSMSNSSIPNPKEQRRHDFHTNNNNNNTDSSSCKTRNRRIFRWMICASGICGCYLWYGILQEKLATEHTLDTSFVLLSQCAMNVLLAIIWKQVVQPQQAQITQAIPAAAAAHSPPLPHGLLAASAMCYAIATVCSNEAIRYVSYPVQVLVKSIKLVPIMLIGQFLGVRKQQLSQQQSRSSMYSTHEWIAAFLISLGIVGFQYYQHNNNDDNHSTTTWMISNSDDSFWYGMSLLGISLILDGVLGSCQNWIKQISSSRRRPTAGESMLYINGYAFLGLFAWTVMTGSISSGIRTIRWDPHLGMALFILNATAAAGQVFIFLTVAWFSPVITTMITTTRKFGTIGLSVLWYGHAFAPIQYACMILIFAGLYLAIYHTVVVFQPTAKTTTIPEPAIRDRDKSKRE